jgi:uncharacterized protein YndB with AHSA1/START domain
MPPPNKSFERTARQLASYQRRMISLGLCLAGLQPLNSGVMRQGWVHDPTSGPKTLGCQVQRLMTKRVDKASRFINAPPSTIYEAFATPAAMETWLPPEGMTGTMLEFDFREGGMYRMRLSYKDREHTPGKTSEHSDEVEVRFVKLVQDQRIEQPVTFNTDSTNLAGVMRITWVLDGTRHQRACLLRRRPRRNTTGRS